MGLRTIINNLLHPLRVLPSEEAYNLWAPTYDQRDNNAILFAEESAMLPLLAKAVLPNRRIVDFGCGSGRHILHCIEFGGNNIVGIDSSSSMLKLASSKPAIANTHLVQARIEEIPFIDSCFDLGIEALALSHLSQINKGVGEMSRVLRPDGILLISDLHWSFDERGWKRTFDSSLAPKKRLAVEHYSHHLDAYLGAFEEAHLDVEEMITPKIDQSIRPFFVRAGMERTYTEFEGQPLLIAFKLRKQ